MGGEDTLSKVNNPSEGGESEEEELIDPMDTLKEQCGQEKSCQVFSSKLEDCTKRVTSRKKTTETCQEELIDYFHCVDHCVAETLFSKLK